MNKLQAPLSFATLAFVAVIAGCNPEGPGATGSISLGAGVDTTGAKTLEIRAAPDADPAWTSASPRFPSADSDSLWSETSSLADIKFPYEYEVGDLVGQTDHERYRIVAWLSAAGSGDAPASGESYGTSSFVLAACGEPVGGYCGVTFGVDVAIELVAP